jgi:hypothetical protein
MPSFNRPTLVADELREVARSLACATGRMYSAIGVISLTLGSLSHALYQLGATVDQGHQFTAAINYDVQRPVPLPTGRSTRVAR